VLFWLLAGDVDVSGLCPNRLKRGSCIASSSLIRSEVARRYRYDIRLRHGLEDWDFYLTLVENRLSGVLVDDTYVWYRVHGASMGHAVQRDRIRRQRTYLLILWKHRRFLGTGAIVGMVRRSVRYRLRAGFRPRGDGRATEPGANASELPF
jgi:hypothetical protein